MSRSSSRSSSSPSRSACRSPPKAWRRPRISSGCATSAATRSRAICSGAPCPTSAPTRWSRGLAPSGWPADLSVADPDKVDRGAIFAKADLAVAIYVGNLPESVSRGLRLVKCQPAVLIGVESLERPYFQDWLALEQFICARVDTGAHWLKPTLDRGAERREGQHQGEHCHRFDFRSLRIDNARPAQ